MPGRESERTKHRTPCTISIGAQRHNGLVTDFSCSGLFIQTGAKPDIGSRLDVEMVIDGARHRLQVEVARRKQVPPQLRTVAHGGVGVRILTAPEEFYQLLAETQGAQTSRSDTRPKLASRKASATRGAGSASTRVAAKPAATAAPKSDPPRPGRSARPRTEPAPNQYRVRVKQVAGNRTRTLTVLGSDEASAREEAAEDLGDDWKILEITPL